VLTGCAGSCHAKAVQSSRLGLDDEIIDATDGSPFDRPANTEPGLPVERPGSLKWLPVSLLLSSIRIPIIGIKGSPLPCGSSPSNSGVLRLTLWEEDPFDLVAHPLTTYQNMYTRLGYRYGQSPVVRSDVRTIRILIRAPLR
jgi:hypothetical protein